MLHLLPTALDCDLFIWLSPLIAIFNSFAKCSRFFWEGLKVASPDWIDSEEAGKLRSCLGTCTRGSLSRCQEGKGTTISCQSFGPWWPQISRFGYPESRMESYFSAVQSLSPSSWAARSVQSRRQRMRFLQIRSVGSSKQPHKSGEEESLCV